MFKQKQKAFTLIELLVVIAIIGILATLAVVSLQQARQNARDSKRMADMKQLHTALELFANKYGRYPTTEEWNQGFIGSSTENIIFMQNIPNAPTPADGNCLDSSNTYIYIPQNNGATYTINFCTGKQVSDLPEGAKQMTPGGIVFGSGESGGGTPAWTCGDDFTDERDDNIYPTVQIGDQCWFAKNLAYLPGIIHSNTEFNNQGTNSLPGYGVYGYNGSVVADAKAYMHTDGNTFNMYQTYGVLYNWFAVNQTGENAICPPGWHVPSHDEWTDLERAICTSGSCETDFPYDTTTTGWKGTNEGKKLKSARTAVGSPVVGYSTNDHPRWIYNSTNFGTDNFDFNALPAGYRNTNGSFYSLGSNAYLWSSSIDGSSAWHRYLYSSNSSVHRRHNSLASGFSVRCLRTE
jgi:uncharacterized protein (TIGR02145 family)/prepilin-type N-terminal cleavage/methylation domain-containing protein